MAGGFGGSGHAPLERTREAVNGWGVWGERPRSPQMKISASSTSSGTSGRRCSRSRRPSCRRRALHNKVFWSGRRESNLLPLASGLFQRTQRWSLSGQIVRFDTARGVTTRPPHGPHLDRSRSCRHTIYRSARRARVFFEGRVVALCRNRYGVAGFLRPVLALPKRNLLQFARQLILSSADPSTPLADSAGFSTNRFLPILGGRQLRSQGA